MTALCFVDTEATGLHPELHHIWEVGLIVRHNGTDTEYLWQLPVDLSTADPFALEIGGFWERRWPEPEDEGDAAAALRGTGTHSGTRSWIVPLTNREHWCDRFMELTHGCLLVGNVVSFDAERLAALLRWEQRMPTWHHHLIDVEVLAAGWLAAGHDWTEGAPVNDKCMPPWDSDELSAALGVTVAEEDRHTALGDARWARDLYDAVMGNR